MAEPVDPVVSGGAPLAGAYAFCEPDVRRRALDLLDRLAGQGRPEVWTALFEIFRISDDLAAEPETAELLALIATGLEQNPSLKPDATFVIQRLPPLYPFEAGLIARLLLALSRAWSRDLGDVRTGVASIAPEVIGLAVTLHRLPATRAAGLEIFELLMELDAYDARLTVDDLDNWLRPGRRPMRRRLPRRSRGSRRVVDF